MSPRRPKDGIPGSVYAKRGLLYVKVHESAGTRTIATGLADTKQNRATASQIKRQAYIHSLLPDAVAPRLPSYQQAFDRFLHERIISDATRTNYTYGFKRVVTDPNRVISADGIMRFAVQFRHDSTLSKVSVNTYLRAYRVFALWCEKTYRLPSSDIGSQFTRIAPREQLVFTAEEVALMVNDSTHKAMAHMVGFMVETGARTVDALTLDWKNVNLRDGLITWENKITKAKETRPISSRCVAHLYTLCGTKPLKSGKVYPWGYSSARGVMRNFERLCARCGIDTTGRSLKTLRKTFKARIDSLPWQYQQYLMRHHAQGVTETAYQTYDHRQVRAMLDGLPSWF